LAKAKPEPANTVYVALTARRNCSSTKGEAAVPGAVPGSL
jgi:hypothetical protein